MHLGKRLGTDVTGDVPRFGVMIAAVAEDLRGLGYGDAVAAVLP
jgi:hypothetical protein